MSEQTLTMEQQDILRRVQEEGVAFVDLQFTDLMGVVKNVTVPSDQLATVLAQGIWFDGSSIEGMARVAESDMYLVPDLATYAVIPWTEGEGRTARLICHICTPNSEPALSDPRRVLYEVQQRALKMNLVFKTSPEMEFFLLRPNGDAGAIPPRPSDSASYFDMPTDITSGLRREMTVALRAFGIAVESLHHEVATGQHEIQFQYDDALRSADNAMTLRVALKMVAEKNGLYGTFMPKPLRNASGSGMHVHQSLFYAADEVNAFADAGDPHGLSDLARHFLAGQLAHARGMCAILAPLVNSYKRLVPGFEAPINVSWGRINRSALIRVPRAMQPERTRLEIRCPDASCNPYLAFAVMLAAGLDGIRRRLDPPEATDEDLFSPRFGRGSLFRRLPSTLAEALDALEEDEVIQEALGLRIYRSFLDAKRSEWADYSQEVTDWELAHYLRY